MTSKQSCIIMVGAFPPPVHGMAAVNAAVREHLQTSFAELRVINLSAPKLNRSMVTRLGRLPKILCGLVRLAGFRGGTLYMSVSGGLGQIYELIFLVLARLCRMRVFLHHHSFAYLDRPNMLTALIAKLAGANAMHIVLSPGMATRLKEVYGVERVTPVSNTFIFS